MISWQNQCNVQILDSQFSYQLIFVLTLIISYLSRMPANQNTNPQSQGPMDQQTKSLVHSLFSLSLSGTIKKIFDAFKNKQYSQCSMKQQLQQTDFLQASIKQKPEQPLGSTNISDSDPTPNKEKNTPYITYSDTTYQMLRPNVFWRNNHQKIEFQRRPAFFRRQQEQQEYEKTKKWAHQIIRIQPEVHKIQYGLGGAETFYIAIDEEKPGNSNYNILSSSSDKHIQEEKIKSPSKIKRISKKIQSPSKNSKQNFQSQRTQVKKQKRSKQPKIYSNVKKCHCKLNGCKKSQDRERIYCYCLLAGQKCTFKCQCFDCENCVKPLSNPQNPIPRHPMIPESEQISQIDQQDVEVSMEFEGINLLNYSTQESSSKICECEDNCVTKKCPCFVAKGKCGGQCGCEKAICKNQVMEYNIK